MNWSRIRELVRKEFIQLLRDKRNRAVLFVAPIIQMLVFGYVVNYDIRTIRVAVVDYSHTLESRKLMDAFEGSRIFSITHFLNDENKFEESILQTKDDPYITLFNFSFDTENQNTIYLNSYTNNEIIKLKYDL